uniref:O-antigen ligase family protein n=1 Tax=uncultured Draconibacterium sp. TaxID=1573823 RepID=UPI0032168B53
MKLRFTRLNQINWFYIASLIFAIALPFSNALISVSSALLIVASIAHYKNFNLKSSLKDRRLLLFLMGIYAVYLLGLVFTNDWKWAAYDLRKNMAYFVIPLAFLLAPRLSIIQYKRILYVFAFSVVLSAIITLMQFYLNEDNLLVNAQKYGFMHHIRFSLQIDFSIFILTYLLYEHRESKNRYLKIGIVSSILILATFLIWHQSLTGIITFIVTLVVLLVIWMVKQPKRQTRMVVGIILFAIMIIPVAYLYYAIDRFYSVDVYEPEELEKYTSQGNLYKHNTTNPAIENGHYVWLYVCKKELEKEWNKRSTIKYNSTDKFGYSIKFTLIRYLTSKNLRKDAEGVKALSDSDIKNIENGVSNYILAGKSISLYPRIYVSIWELDSYFRTGNANHRSLAQRIEYSKAAFSIIQENFWLGVGTGNWKKSYRDYYIKSESKMAPARYGNVHNQYLNYMVKFGIVGLILILFFVFYPVIKSKAYRNQLFLLFLIIMFVGNFGDANFETHTGSNFFVFFYCLFMLPKSDQKFFPVMNNFL